MKLKFILLALLISTVSIAQKSIDEKVSDLLSKMTLKEKIGQMNQYNGFELTENNNK